MDKVNKVDLRDSVKTVTSNSFIMARGLANLSLKARKMLYIAISQCKQADSEFYSFEISVNEFANLMGITTEGVYAEADRITDELMRGVLEIAQTKKYFKKFALFSTCEYEHNGKLKFKLNPDMTEFLLELKGDFSQPLLQDFMRMNSPYSMAVWHLMQKEMHSKKPGVTETIRFELSLSELREVTGTQNKFRQVGQFKERVFDKALREIEENCGVKITYSNIKESRVVIGFQCEAICSFHIEESNIPQNIKDKCELYDLKRIAKSRKLTTKEQERYDYLSVRFSNLTLSF